jgi:hypothetical protein
LTTRGVIRVQQVRTGAHSTLIWSQVLCTSLARWWIEECDLVGTAVDWFIPGCED